MDKEQIYERIQKQLSMVPLMLIGTGGSMPYGIPGMKALADRLIESLSAKYSHLGDWHVFEDKLVRGMDLENALVDIHFSDEVIVDIVEATWQLVCDKDIELMKSWDIHKNGLPLGKIIRRFYQADPRCVNIITTNYDRVIEYACDQMGLPVNTLFRGEYFKRYCDENIQRKNIVNVLKVHGSLDWYFKDGKQVVAIPLQESIPLDFQPAIVTPGTSKYENVLKSPFRDILHEADTLIMQATGYLCIGYGFNDNQIQTKLIEMCRLGKPITIWTKWLSDAAINLIKSSSDNYIIVLAEDNDQQKSKILFSDGTEIIDEKIWDQEGLLKVIGG